MLSAFLCVTLSFCRYQPGEEPAFLGKTVDAWRETVRSKTATVAERRRAVWALGCFGPEAKSAAPDLIEFKPMSVSLRLLRRQPWVP